MRNPSKKTKKIEPQTTKVKKGKVALFSDNIVISGDCVFTATKADKFSGEAVFQITMIKDIS